MVNGSAHHTDHHLFYNFNYGQFFTLWDRIGGSFRYPSAFEGQGPIMEILEKEKHKVGAMNGYSNGVSYTKGDNNGHVIKNGLQNGIKRD